MCTTRVCAVCLTADKNGSHFGVQREPSASHMDREIWLGRGSRPASAKPGFWRAGAGLGITPMSKNSKNSFRTRDRTDARSAPTLDAAGLERRRVRGTRAPPGGPRAGGENEIWRSLFSPRKRA